jgi:uncharacterized protein YndB with AHSA1/START domain/DNA-binding transcriptional ArsR family regulator
MERAGQHQAWKALADASRRRLLDLIRGGPRTTGQLAERFECSRFAVMKHLAVLEEAGLVKVERRGRERWNHLNTVPIREIYERWISPYQELWAGRLLRLQRAAEGRKETEMTSGDQTVRSFSIVQEVAIKAPPAKVYAALTRHLSAWWGAPFLLGADTRDLTLDARPGGHLFEAWGKGGTIWATVTAARPGELVDLEGHMGIAGAVAGRVRFEVAPDAGGSRVKLTHQAVGLFAAESEANYGGGWQDLLGRRLKAFVETGERLGLKAKAPARRKVAARKPARKRR